MAEIEYNKKYNNTFAPNLLKLTNENSERQDNKVYNNEKGVLLYEDAFKQIFLKEELQVKNYCKCFKPAYPSLALTFGTGRLNNKPNNYVYGYLYSYDYPIRLYLRDIWVIRVDNRVGLESDRSAYLQMNSGYICFASDEKLVQSADSEINYTEGYISSISLSKNNSEETNILSKVRVSKIQENFEYMTVAEQRTALGKYNVNTPYTSQRVISLYKISLDGPSKEYPGYPNPGYVDAGFGYDIDYFVEKTYNESFEVSINTSRRYKEEDTYYQYENNTFKIPVQVIMQNRLIWILTGLGWAGDIQGDFNYLVGPANADAKLGMQVWCPDQNYLIWTVTSVDSNFSLEVNEVWGNNCYRYMKWSANTQAKGHIGYVTINFYYNKGDISYSASYGCQLLSE